MTNTVAPQSGKSDEDIKIEEGFHLID
jgi:hypothetical protein